MNNFLLIIAALVVAAFTALFAVPPLIDWNTYRGAFEEEVSRLLDREVRVRGDVSVRLLPVPYISFEKVRIADAPGVPGSFARAEQFKMWLAVPPLLRGVIEARQVELEDAIVRLRTEADGSGNWAKLRIRPGALAYTPADVAFNSVQITNGTVLLESHHGHEITKLTSISGEMTAPALAGPYKFIGTAPLNKKPHEVRIATATPDDGGDIRFNASVRSPDNRTVHSINGSVSDLLGKASASGRLTSRHRPPSNETGAAGYELTADVKLVARSLRLDDIAISFQSEGRQQTLNGQAITSWREGVVTETTLAARWLDLNAIARVDPSMSPLRVVEKLLTQGIEPLGAGVTSLNVSIDQANLAGASISNLQGRMVRREGVTKIESLRVALPGLSALAADGFLGRRDDGLRFDGNILVRSASLSELGQWLKADLDEYTQRLLATSFSMNGDIRVRPKQFELSDALVKLADATAEGGFTYSWDGRPVLVATVDADKLALERFGQNLLSPAQIARTMGLGQPPPATTAPSTGNTTTPSLALLPQEMDLTLSLRAREITDGRRIYRDVVADFGRNGNDLALTQLKGTWMPGLTFDLSGNISDAPTSPAGKLIGTIATKNTAAAAQLNELLSLVSNAPLPHGWLTERPPMRLAITTTLGQRTAPSEPPGSRIVADGTLGPDRIRIDAQTNGPLHNWMTQYSNVDVRISGENTPATLQRVLGLPNAKPQNEPSASPITVLISATGNPATGMKTVARAAGGQAVQAGFAGTVTVTPPDGDQKNVAAIISGDVDVDQISSNMLARVIWPDVENRVGEVAVKGTVGLQRTATGALKLAPRALRVGQTRLNGNLTLASGKADLPPQLSGSLRMSQATLRHLSAALLFTNPQSAWPPASASNNDVAQPIWPKVPFGFSHLTGLTSNVDVTIAKLSLGANPRPSQPFQNARFRLTASNQGVAIKNFTALRHGQSIAGNIDFAASRAGVQMTGDIAATAIKLSRWAPTLTAEKRLTGAATVSLKIKGRAQSPNAMVSSLSGTGTIRLKDVTVPGIDSETVTTIARAFIDGDLNAETFDAELIEKTRAGRIELGDPTLNVRITNGTVALPEIVFEQDAGGLRNATFIDLDRARIDSRWTITPAPQPSPNAPAQTIALPPVTVTYVGNVDELPRIEPQIDRGDLERELIVRRMEANVARLERLRREDEARAAAEAERQRQVQEEERRARAAERARIKREREERLLEQQRIRNNQRQERRGAGSTPPTEAATLAPATNATVDNPQEPAADAEIVTTPVEAAPQGRTASTLNPAGEQRRRPRRVQQRKRFNPFSTTD